MNRFRYNAKIVERIVTLWYRSNLLNIRTFSRWFQHFAAYAGYHLYSNATFNE